MPATDSIRVRHHLRRLTALLAILAALVLVTAGPASAQTVGGTGSSDYVTRLLSFPAPAGVTLTVAENGNKLLLTNSTSTPLTVLGYEGEPYLVVTPEGVQENQRSQATFLNVDRYNTTAAVPPTADNKGVDYTTISGKPVAIWHDHRIHWMAASPPPAVTADPGRYRVIQTWQVHFLYGSTPLVATGELDWVPGPSPLPSILVALAALIVVGGLAVRSCRLLGAGLLLLTAADVVHTVGVAADRAGTSVAAGFGAYPVVDVSWAFAVLAAVLLLTGTRPRMGLTLTVATSAWMLLVGGIADVATFSDTSSPFVWSIALDRVLTAIELGTGIAVLALAVRGLIAVAAEHPRTGAGRWKFDDDENWDDGDLDDSSRDDSDRDPAVVHAQGERSKWTS